ncbi:zinc-dependent peptidase [Bordetella petrii]|uniref:M90 family metallopeptidase n=1 Tax=Bordetella petrii TaxID=94624 RepID=UPI001E5BA629|nr:M90 family metallopeptidase [Bordetella petrii]MCD0506155.1 zinc-dependent peptidase [Bordetella petrii]
MFRWLKGRGAAASTVAEVQARIPPGLWQQVLDAHPFMAALGPDEAGQLQARAAWLLASKNINGARGAELTDFMRLSIAAQAALPILNLSPSLYEGWDEIIVYPEGFSIPRMQQDDAGVVHEYDEPAAGEAWEGGPVILSWADTVPNGTAFNVVIHEFAHKLDLGSGNADGMPGLGAHSDLSPRTWRRVLDDSLDRFTAALDALEASIPPDMDPESPAADTWYGQLPLDPYAAADEAEFFAVSSEHFFVDPAPLAQALPDWYGLLCRYYRQDPLARLERPAATGELA